MKNKKDRRDCDFMLDVAKEYVQVTGREALDHLLEGEAVYSVESCLVLKVIDGVLCCRDYSIRDNFTESSIGLSAFLDPNYNDWYIKPPFDARKELLERPNEWVAKYFAESEQTYYYLGFDSNEMCAVFNHNLEPEVTVRNINADIAEGQMLDQAVPLSKNDIKVLSTMKVDAISNKFKDK